MDDLFSYRANQEEAWRKEWVGMPDFESKDLTSYRKIIVHFRNEEDVQDFAKLLGQKITKKQPSLWHPVMPIRKTAHLLYVQE